MSKNDIQTSLRKSIASPKTGHPMKSPKVEHPLKSPKINPAITSSRISVISSGLKEY